MPTPSFARALRRLLLPALLLTTASAAHAQYPAGAVVQSLPRPGDPAELLATALRTLAVEPSNLAALTAAGHNALVLGDPNAAVGFFGRAQEIAPRDGHVKAGLGSALIELEKPQDALRLFAEASRLGVPEDEIAEDRGLAYDLTGDPKRAQRDYAIVLAAHPEDDTVRRRLALSQGISGDKAAAIATLDPLIRKRDIAGWRAQTFVLAMNGDAKGASDITHIMLPQQADMLQPFLVRLASLSPADKARAVNFGEMPAAGHAYTPSEIASTGTAPTYASPPVTRPAPRVASRPSDLAPLPTPAPRPATTVATSSPALRTPVPTPVTPGANAAYSSAPLAGIALTPSASAPTPQVATQITPTIPAQTTPAPSPAPTPTPVETAQASPASTMASGPPALALPTPAAVGHYDLPHDVAHPSASASARSAVTPSPTVAAMKTIGTPVVHGDTTAAETASVPTPTPKPTRIATAETSTRRKPVEDQSADTTPPAKHAKGRASASDADDAPVPTKSKRGTPLASDGTDDSTAKRHARTAKSTGADEADDATTGDRKGRKGAHGKLAAADDGDAPTKGRKGKHDTADATDDSGSASKSRKGAHGTRLAATDDGDDGTSKSLKGAHGKKASDDDSDSRSSRSSKKDDAKASPERVFVQVAGGANKDDMDKAWTGLKKKAPDLMKGHTPQTAPVHATNRLLVGPFKSDEEAQAFVNKMAAKGLSGFTVKTPKGTKVEKIDGGQ